QGPALVPIDIRLDLVNFFTFDNAQLRKLRRHLPYRALHLWQVVLRFEVSVVRGNGETFSFNQHPGNSIERVAQLFFRGVEPGQKLRAHLFAQSAWAGDIKTVAAGVDDCVDAHALADVFQIATAENGDRRFCSQLA